MFIKRGVESGFKSAIIWNKYLPKTIHQARNWYLNFLIDLSFQGVQILFVLLFKGGESHRQYYLQTAEIKGYVMIDRRNFFDQPIKNDSKNIW